VIDNLVEIEVETDNLEEIDKMVKMEESFQARELN
jgi:nicotinate-nucleotide pyrophosphorylase